jgi:hypothetical protein
MRPLVLTEKTGFMVLQKNVPVIIRDYRGMLFYSTESLLPRVSAFNLPAGNYFVVSGYFKPMNEPVQYKKLKLPRPERVIPKDPRKFKIVFASNPHKCTIDFVNEQITFDYSFKEKTLPEIYFVLYHEFAHKYYKTEKYCDALASNYMLEKGFNPSQIGRAQITTLSERQLERKIYNVNKLINESK